MDATVVKVAAPSDTVLTATLHGRSGRWPVQDSESLLETVLRSRADAPYACKGGVCGTCRAFLVTGEVRMDRNFALEPEETEAGFVLACQSHPLTPEVELDFDRLDGSPRSLENPLRPLRWRVRQAHVCRRVREYGGSRVRRFTGTEVHGHTGS
ncbi:hypothetical protein SCALM49S_02559 [Streptomyces californicus]